MTERLLQYIWQFQYFNKNALATTTGEALQIVQIGLHNTNQGPDFLAATIKIASVILAGSIELHIKSSDWKKHGHTDDVHYNNVVLHVVWEDDAPAIEAIPTLVLQDRIPKMLLQQYHQWMSYLTRIPCSGQAAEVKYLIWATWKERLLVERLKRKAEYILDILHNNQQHWEETFWQLLARNFGLPINADAFEAIAQSIPLSILAKHKNQLASLEALLLGQASLLPSDTTEKYAQLLTKEYAFLQKKYKLIKPAIPLKLLRMRPASFPAIRLAQLAALIHQSNHLFATIKETLSVKVIMQTLATTANDYWHYHYHIDEPTAFKEKTLGIEMVQNIVINTIIPMLFTYGLYRNEIVYKEKALHWLTQIAPEKNSITKLFTNVHISNIHAYDSQSLIELKTQYCDKKRCLDCAIGHAILKEGT
jgi:hypothetical protein